MVKWQFPEISLTFLSVEFSKKKKKQQKQNPKSSWNKKIIIYIIYVIFKQKLLSDYEREGI